jgi:hypothetical protein
MNDYFYVRADVEALLQAVKGWKPRRFVAWSERQYSDHLFDFLQGRLDPSVAVERSRYLTDRSRRPDLRLAFETPSGTERLFVEAKLDLGGEGEYRRLQEQIGTYMNRVEPPVSRLLVLVVGTCRADYVTRLDAQSAASERLIRQGGAEKLSRRLRFAHVPLS